MAPISESQVPTEEPVTQQSGETERLAPPSFVAKEPAIVKKPAKPKKRRIGRALGIAAGVSLVSLLALWIAIQKVPWLGPALADGARAVLGPEAVAWVEDQAYTAQDAVNRWRYKDAAPKQYWQEPVLPPPPVPVPVSGDGGAPAAAPTFPPPAAKPPVAEVAGKNDGVWIPIADDVHPNAPPVMAKTLIHPDAKRTFSAVAIVAMDLEKVKITSVAGTDEPASETVKRAQRPGKIPEADHASLIAAFNGGWQAIHGHFGMKVDGLVLLPPKDASCTLALYKDGSIAIRTWKSIADTDAAMQSYRQTPPCLVEQGVLNKDLNESTKSFGAAVDGGTVIRRSGIGLSKDKKILFYGSGDGLTAQTLGQALAAAGAHDVAELDVNWAFPRYLFYGHKGGAPAAGSSLIPCVFKPNEYVGISFYRDYFYVTRTGP
ncbi:MAG: phosphodiester glycosidase family protein [Myxococcales bacterium]|jgi:hypothetical protein|nr:phosphodiester glycosidase family protein [Myxococcales bacterium]